MYKYRYNLAYDIYFHMNLDILYISLIILEYCLANHCKLDIKYKKKDYSKYEVISDRAPEYTDWNLVVIFV